MLPPLTQNFKAITLVVLACFASSIGDMLMQHLSHTICPYHILSIKYGVTLLGAIIIQHYHCKNPIKFNLTAASRIRSILLFGAISLWTYGLKDTSLPTATAISFCGPLIALGFAHYFLKERVQFINIIPLLICFIGVLIFVGPIEKLHTGSIVNLVGATILFALMDCMNKSLSAIESPLQATMSIAVICTVLSILAGSVFPLTIRLQDVSILIAMGGFNLILIYAMMAAYKLTCLKVLLPWKYSELLISVILSVIVLDYIPTLRMALGMTVIGLSPIYVLIMRDRKFISTTLFHN